MKKNPPCVMTFSATDPTGGAGLQADVLTLASLGCHPLSVTTAITVQDTSGVESMMAFDADWVNDQARTLLEDIEVSAFKLGLLGSVETIAMIAEIVADYPTIPLIIDPVLASGRGDALVTNEMINAMSDLLLSQATLITPNSIEARRLAFKDGDGDIGILSADTSSPNDLKMKYLYKDIDGIFKPFDAIDTTAVMDTLFYSYRVPNLTPDGQYKALDGEIRAKLRAAPIYYPGHHTVKFEITLRDRAGHVSNKVTTNEIVVP